MKKNKIIQNIITLIICFVILIGMTSCVDKNNTNNKQSNKGIEFTNTTIVKNRTSEYTILIPQNATETEKYAAEELSKYYYQISKTRINIENENGSSKSTNDKIISIGNTKFKNDTIGSAYVQTDFNKEGFVQKTIDNSIFFFGGDEEQGTLYAVYDYLETCVDCKFYTPECEYIPQYGTIYLPLLDNIDVPWFSIRCAVYDSLIDGAFASKVRMKTFQAPEGENNEKYGRILCEAYNGHKGSSYMWGTAHNINTILQYDKYKNIYPEWFPNSSQFNQPQFLPIFGVNEDGTYDTSMELNPVDVAVETIKNAMITTDSYYFNLSQGDDTVTDTNAEYNKRAEKIQQSGIYIQFINLVCEKLDEWIASETKPDGLFPNGREYNILTFAYGHTQYAPIDSNGKSLVEINKNICIWLAPIYFNHIYTYTDSRQFLDVQDIVQNWTKCTSNVAIWDYYANFNSRSLYYSPYISVAPTNYKDYADCGIRTFVMSQFSDFIYAPRSAHDELKTYISSKLLWDPYGYDVNELIEDFCSGVYGDCSEEVLATINAMEDNFAILQQTNGKTFLDHSNANSLWSEYISLDLLNNNIALIDKAIIKNQNGDAKDKDRIDNWLKRIKLMFMSNKLIEFSSYYPVGTSIEKKAISDEFFALIDETGYDDYFGRMSSEALLRIEGYKAL